MVLEIFGLQHQLPLTPSTQLHKTQKITKVYHYVVFG